MKIKSLLIATLLMSSVSFAQETAVADTSWKSGGLFSLGFNQVSLSNWAAGGFSSVSGNAVLSAFKNYAKDKIYWDNTLDLGYGLLQQNSETLKTDDRIDIASKYGRQAWNEKWYYSLLGNFKTQFTEGLGDEYKLYDSPDSTTFKNKRNRISDFLAPGYAILALGLDHKPNDNFTLFISPLTAKFTFVQDEDLADAGAFGVEKAVRDDAGIITKHGLSSRTELGAYLKAAYVKDISENIKLMTKVDLFTNYQESPFTHTDVNWELLLGLKINKYISANIGFQTLYDHDIDIVDSDGKVGPRTQVKEFFGLGFAYEL